MLIQNHPFVDEHIIGCSPVKSTHVEEDNVFVPQYYIEVYTTGGAHRFDSKDHGELNQIYNQIFSITTDPVI